MSQIAFTGGGVFATSRRGGYDSAALAQAKDMLQRLGSYQAASHSTGVPVAVLREAFPNVRRDGFRPAFLGPAYVAPEPPKVPPLPPKVFADNDRVASLVKTTVAKHFGLKQKQLQAARGGTALEVKARMIFLSNISYFTSWDMARISEYCGFTHMDSAPAAMRRYEARLADNPDYKAIAEKIRAQITVRIVAIVGG